MIYAEGEEVQKEIWEVVSQAGAFADVADSQRYGLFAPQDDSGLRFIDPAAFDSAVADWIGLQKDRRQFTTYSALLPAAWIG